MVVTDFTLLLTTELHTSTFSRSAIQSTPYSSSLVICNFSQAISSLLDSGRNLVSLKENMQMSPALSLNALIAYNQPIEIYAFPE
jgi:hypothetical protein